MLLFCFHIFEYKFTCLNLTYLLLTGNLETDSHGISTQLLAILLVIAGLVPLVLVGVGVALYKYLKKRRKIAETPVVEGNNYYGVKFEDYYEDRGRDTEVVDLNDYYGH